MYKKMLDICTMCKYNICINTTFIQGEKIMKIASWIFTVLSFLSFPIFIVLGYFENNFVYGIIFSIIGFLLLSYIAHILAGKCFDDGGKIPFYITYPGFILPMVVMYVIFGVLSFLDWVVYAFTRRYYIAEFLGWMRSTLLFTNPIKKQTEKTKKEEIVYLVDDRKLKYEWRYTDFETKLDYNRFRDDLGNYWRSYDDNKTFIQEHGEQTYEAIKIR